MAAHMSTISRAQKALEAAGVEFIDENGGGPGVRLRKRQGKTPTPRPTLISPKLRPPLSYCELEALGEARARYTTKRKHFLFANTDLRYREAHQRPK